MSLVIEPLHGRHRRERFNSGEEELDRYLREQAGQDVRRRAASCHVLRAVENLDVIGYYTLSMNRIDPSVFPEVARRRLPRYPDLPAALLGRLAIDTGVRGQRLGDLLLTDAIERVLNNPVAALALIVDALHERAAGFYEHFGFARFPDDAHRLFLPLSNIKL
ncbi:MAG TPA: GNAT family N-acetyltransferase [Dehalococcoidia bacterium]|nr:GNAT family N-acetyltransferase [Dehalococcoidia bacterium]